MNGETRPATVRALRTHVSVSLRHGVTTEITKGDTFEGHLNEYGNFYLDGVYIGSLPHDFIEVEVSA